MKNRTMKEMNEQFRDCPFQVNDYEIDGRIYHVTSYFVGDKDVNEVIRQYAENKAISEILSQFAEKYDRINSFFEKLLPIPIQCAIIIASVKVALEERSL